MDLVGLQAELIQILDMVQQQLEHKQLQYHIVEDKMDHQDQVLQQKHITIMDQVGVQEIVSQLHLILYKE